MQFGVENLRKYRRRKEICYRKKRKLYVDVAETMKMLLMATLVGKHLVSDNNNNGDVVVVVVAGA